MDPATNSASFDLADVAATAVVQAVADGSVSVEEWVSACGRRIADRDGIVKAWAHYDADHAVSQARQLDGRRRAGMAIGPLNGLPLAIKDIIDTADMPTEDGTVLHQGRRPSADAAVVAALRAAGAVIMGKTVTAEMATYSPGATTNPWDPERTPGGSSSGSAAAVAAGMVPAAIGTQTNGSVIRPASYCGVVGYKPSFGWISRRGVLPVSKSLDTVGVFARCVEDAALVAQTLLGYDAHDPAMRCRTRPDLLASARAKPPIDPRLAFVRTPAWDLGDADMHDGFAELLDSLGENVDEVELADGYAPVYDWHKIIMETELAVSFERDYQRGKDQLSGTLQSMIERGRSYRASEYCLALERRAGVRTMLAELFTEFDALITPAATGEAPRGLDSTGDPVFCTLWTYAGLPCISLPLLQSGNGLPVGVQLVAAVDDDARLLRTANWLSEHLN